MLALKLQYGRQTNLRVVYKTTQNGTVVEQINYNMCSVRLVFYDFMKSNTSVKLIPIFFRESRVRDTNSKQLSINNYLLSIIPCDYIGQNLFQIYFENYINLQNSNRYDYVLNLPLKYTRYSEEFWHLVIGAIIGIYMGETLANSDYNQANIGYISGKN